ncbi:lipopolysaccharide export LptBFGC system permease protein LptF [Cytobacillus eiseniae]|uniref:Lipopolysaccharide export LptBFGC system permease protein LptF n=1 Tax=Cytobacillus eiseniae TaxID=762947 RepID=A0ABS4RA69_9BACI|nr:hypothetical protein [Cytobacillus eiseniae]MBP2239784.1 lipopolysaccharide export LptBFGC system permease protein LptF [Cytobacillus eiseniae]
MEFELNLKNKRVRVWLWLMVPAFILSIALFIYLPSGNSVYGAIPLIVSYFIYFGWSKVKNRQTQN